MGYWQAAPRAVPSAYPMLRERAHDGRYGGEHMTTLDYPFAAPESGTSVRVAEGVEWIRLPLPFRPGHVNVYRLEDDAGGTFAVDTGLADETTASAWARLGPIPERVVVTHFHPDHIGQAARFEAEGAITHAPAPELARACELHELSGERLQATLAAFFAANGVVFPAGAVSADNGYRRAVPALPQAPRPLAAGPLPFSTRWNVHFAGGHSPAHALLYRDQDAVLAAGDILLPEISPNVSVWPDDPDADPLGEYLASLHALEELPEHALVLPAHGAPYRGIKARLNALVAHHEKRLNILRAATVARPVSAGDVIPRLFRREIRPASLSFALGEALAHLNRLWHAGEFKRFRDHEGVWRYRAVR